MEKEMHLWSSSNKRVSPTKKHLHEKKVFAGRDKTTLKLDWSLFNGDWKIMATFWGTHSQPSTKMNQIFFGKVTEPNFISTPWIKKPYKNLQHFSWSNRRNHLKSRCSQNRKVTAWEAVTTAWCEWPSISQYNHSLKQAMPVWEWLCSGMNSSHVTLRIKI